MRKNNKGITLIALVVTIIVLLILAGVSIITLTGDNGIINRTQQAKQLSEEAAAREKVKLAVQAARVHDKSYSYLKASEVRDAVNNEEGLSTAQKGDFPVVVTAGKFKFTISSTGEVGDIEGIIIPETENVILGGSGKTLTPELGDGITGTVEWSSSDSTKVSVENGTITAVAASNSPITITASIKDLATGIVYKDTCAVTVASKITQITVSKNSIEISNGGTATISTATTADVVISNIQPEGNVESLVYSSSNTSIASVSADGTITANAVGTATISIKGETQSSTDTALATISVTVKKGSVSSIQIKTKTTQGETVTENTENVGKTAIAGYYGKEVTNYKVNNLDLNGNGTANESLIYRLFYVDYEGDFGEPGSIYLKADYSDNSAVQTSLSLYDTTSLDDTTNKPETLIKDMNPKWAGEVNGGKRAEANWNTNEKAAAWLCQPTRSSTTGLWKDFYDISNSSKINYIIGSPSVDMYIASYKATHTTTDLDFAFSTTATAGYRFKPTTDSNLENGYGRYSSKNSIATDCYNMYCTSNKYWWLASPSAGDANNVCSVYGNRAYLNLRDYGNAAGVCPLVSLDSSFIPEVNN